MNALSLAATTAVMTDHVFERLHEYVREYIGEGYMFTVDTVAQWAVKFEKKYKKVDWEDFQIDATKYGFSESCFAWDDAVMEYADKRFDKLKKKGK